MGHALNVELSAIGCGTLPLLSWKRLSSLWSLKCLHIETPLLYRLEHLCWLSIDTK
jgi:hypothetical protein